MFDINFCYFVYFFLNVNNKRVYDMCVFGYLKIIFKIFLENSVIYLNNLFLNIGFVIIVFVNCLFCRLRIFLMVYLDNL